MVWGPLIAAGGSLLGGLFGMSGANQAARRSEDFSREMYEYALKQGPSLEMAGLRKAGINPMLRYGSGGSATPVSMPTMSFPNPMQAMSEGIAGAASSAFGTMKVQQEIEESGQRIRESETRKQGMELEQLYKLPAELERIRNETRLMDFQKDELYYRSRVLVQEEFLREAEARLTEERFREVEAAVRQMDTQAFLNMASAAVRQTENELLQSNLSRAEIDEEFYGQWGGRMARGVENWMRSFGAIFGGANSASQTLAR